MRTIRVTGKGNLKVKPDTSRLMITLNGVYPNMQRRSTSQPQRPRHFVSFWWR